MVLNGFGDVDEIERLRAGIEAEFGVRVLHSPADMADAEAVTGLVRLR